MVAAAAAAAVVTQCPGGNSEWPAKKSEATGKPEFCKADCTAWRTAATF